MSDELLALSYPAASSPLEMAATLLAAIKEDSPLEEGERIDLRKFIHALAGSEDPQTLAQKLSELKQQMFLEIGCGRQCTIGKFLIQRLGFDPAKVYARY
jgi:hypothetical protein